ncbi:MAG: mercury(II) reductase, partial [Firmicutes bacterium]|nr:mercury(II) reductase [Bacillota bacterium]
GSGSAAFAAAIEAREAGQRVAMVERGTVGGTCVNIGCVPSKWFLRAGEVYQEARLPRFPGVASRVEPPDLGALKAGKDRLVERLRGQKYEDLLADYAIDWIPGEAAFRDPGHVRVNGRELSARAFLIATGARPARPAIPGLEAVPYLDSTAALDRTTVPRRLLVIGAGYIALELGQFFHRLGAEVTLVQRGPRLLPGYDPEVGQVVAEVLAAEGIRVVTGVRPRQVDQRGGEIRLTVETQGQVRVLTGDTLLVAAGRQPNTEGLGLDRAGVAVGPRGEPVVDATLRTTNPRVYAAGDVLAGPQFVYVAAYEGKLAARHALGLPDARPVDLSVVPAVTFTDPAIAKVGLTAAEAAAQGIAVDSAVLPLDAVTRALVNQDTRGVFKVTAERGSGRIRGVQVVAAQAGEVIYAATLAVRFGLTVSDLTDTLAPYLTMAEGLRLAALTFHKDVGRLSCCAG